MLSDVYGLTDVSFDRKQEQIQKQLANLVSSADASGSTAPPQADAEPTQPASDLSKEELNLDLALAKFVLLRWDELNELAYLLAAVLKAPSSEQKIVSADILRDALKEIADSQWRKTKSYLDYIRDTESERRDYQMLNIWEVKGSPEASVPGVVSANGFKWLAKTADSLESIKIPEFELFSIPPGGVEIRRSSSK
ncbi:MAG: hypothetical protein WB714_31685 [Candidatus Sulfotelmatobacter sp.]